MCLNPLVLRMICDFIFIFLRAASKYKKPIENKDEVGMKFFPWLIPETKKATE